MLSDTIACIPDAPMREMICLHCSRRTSQRVSTRLPVGCRLSRNSSLLGRLRYWGHFVSEAGGFPFEMLNLSLAVFNLVEGCSFVHIFDSVAEHPVDQAGQLGRHGLDRDGGSQPGSQSTELRSEIGIALLLVGSRPFPMIFSPLIRLSGHNRSQETK